MGGVSTSHSALSRDGRKSSSAYDLRSWQGLTTVLRVAKEKLPPAEHAAFRDLVLQYAQRGGDVEYRKQIDAVLAKLDAPAPKEESKPEPKVEVQKREVATAISSTYTPLRSARPTPRFSVQSAPSAPAPIPEPIEKEETEAPLSVPVPEPEPVVEEAPEPEEVIEERPRSVPVVEEAPSAPKSLEEHKARITEIKRLVNEQIGNPVALVGAHHELGKEYMQALLAALKATGGGGVGADAAMRRLEDSYSALLTDKPQPKEDPVPAASPILKPVPVPPAPAKPVPPVIPKPEPKPEPVPIPEPSKLVPPPMPRPVPPVVPPKPVAPPMPQPQPAPVPRPVPPVPKPVEIPVIRESAPVSTSEPSKPIPPPVPKPVPPVSKPVPSAPQPAPKPTTFSPTAALAARLKELELEAAKQKQSASTSASAPTPIPKPVPPIPKPVAPTPKPAPTAVPEETPVPKPAPAPEPLSHASGFPETKYTQKSIGAVSAEALAASGLGSEIQEARQSQSELASPAITKALHDLLHEWSIFESSGFFGTGPSGPEHPLYIKIAPLSMGEIITGRYEGADRHVNNVIHDYVNAWRHEQGIAYTPSETFEHYLRRVVQRIQKRQTAA